MAEGLRFRTWRLGRPPTRLIPRPLVYETVALKGQVPKRVTAAVLIGVLQSLGYTVRRQPFEITGHRGLAGERRFHVKVDTYAQQEIPREAEIDVHIDLPTDIKKFHKSVAEAPQIAAEMERVVDAVNRRGNDGGVVWADCPKCGKAFHSETMPTHVKVVHG